MSRVDGTQEYETGYRPIGRSAGRPSTPPISEPARSTVELSAVGPTDGTATEPAKSRWARFVEWRAARRETKAAREAAAWDYADRIPPWAFGILHR